MIPQRELATLRAEWSLDQGVIEKDYVLGWLLSGISANPELARTWVFKGGTCLRKCYYETYRFSEDLDFTIIDKGRGEQFGTKLAFFPTAHALGLVMLDTPVSGGKTAADAGSMTVMASGPAAGFDRVAPVLDQRRMPRRILRRAALSPVRAAR